MKQFIGTALLVIGIVLLWMAYDSYNSTASAVSRVITGASTDKTIWLMIGGIAATVVGVSGLLARPKILRS